MDDVLAVENLSIEFSGRRGRQQILQQVSFSIAPGKAYGLVGESGCGKSTIALAAMHFLPAGMSVTGGRVRVDGRDLEGLSKTELRALRGRRIAMVYQDPMASLNPVMTIGRQIAEVALLHGEHDRRRALDRARAMLEEVRIPDAEAMLARYPHQLSGGQQQRVVIAMALMAEPALLVMDEPTTGLDVTIEAAILELVRELRAKLGTAILFISHNLGTVAGLCEDIGVLYAGRLVETGPVRAVFKSPAHPYTRGLLAALPDLDRPRNDGRLVPVEGTLTAEDRARPGCAFAPRCDFAEPATCSSGPIALRDVDGDGMHGARCARLAAVRDSVQPEAHSARPAVDAASAPLVLEICDLSKRYQVGGRFFGRGAGEVHALTGASLEARAGRTIAIVGESGSGKSTLAKVVTGLTEASSGSVRLGGTEIAALPVDERPREVRRRIQMVFQNPDATLNPSHSVEFALRRPLQLLRGLSSREARSEAARLMERVKLPPDLLRRMPHRLSGGQRQRVAIARALAGNPDLIIADEPVSALDVSVQAAIVNLLADLREHSGMALVIISHDLALVRSMADHVAVMYLGRIVEHGPTEQVFAPPSHPYTEALLAAAPRPDPDAGPPAIVLSGAMPSPTAEPRGCPFASRCPKRIPDLCESEPPPQRTFGLHTIACHLELEGLGK